jgi:hypothetical protein
MWCALTKFTLQCTYQDQEWDLQGSEVQTPAYPRLRGHELGTLIGAGRVNTVYYHVAGEVVLLCPSAGVAAWRPLPKQYKTGSWESKAFSSRLSSV